MKNIFVKKAASPAAGVNHAESREFLNELYELLDRDKDKKNVVILELILEQWERLGDNPSALTVADEILKRDPRHPAALAYKQADERWRAGSAEAIAKRAAAAAAASSSSSSSSSSSTSKHKASSTNDKTTETTQRRQGKRAMALGGNPKTEKERREMETTLEYMYGMLLNQSRQVEEEILALKTVSVVEGSAKMVEDAQRIGQGRVSEAVLPVLPRPVRQLLRELPIHDEAACLEAIKDDFLEVAEWAMSLEEEEEEEEQNKTTKKKEDDKTEKVRARLLKRQTLLDAMLPPKRAGLGHTAMTHVEHKLMHLGRTDKTYANTETMLGDPVGEIPASNLLVTRDNYAWDMAELADALAVSQGVMRNPLTKSMFEADDVRQILAHPLGRRLQPLAMSQNELKRGVRTATIDKLAALARTMLEDQSAHATPTIEAIDVFLAYCHTLPTKEKETLNALKVAARDSHTGHEYDSSILEAVRDAKANRVCFHKAGDFLNQAANYLRTLK